MNVTRNLAKVIFGARDAEYNASDRPDVMGARLVGAYRIADAFEGSIKKAVTSGRQWVDFFAAAASGKL